MWKAKLNLNWKYFETKIKKKHLLFIPLERNDRKQKQRGHIFTHIFIYKNTKKKKRTHKIHPVEDERKFPIISVMFFRFQFDFVCLFCLSRQSYHFGPFSWRVNTNNRKQPMSLINRFDCKQTEAQGHQMQSDRYIRETRLFVGFEMLLTDKPREIHNIERKVDGMPMDSVRLSMV